MTSNVIAVTLNEYNFTAAMLPSPNYTVTMNGTPISVNSPGQVVVTATNTYQQVSVVNNGILNVMTPTTSNTDIFNGDGSSTSFLLTQPCLGINFLDVVVGGVYQTKTDSYSISTATVGSTVTTTINFVTPPPIGVDNVIARYYSLFVAENIPGPQGVQGMMGIQGNTGAQGPSQGSQGTQGTMGMQGIQGTSIVYDFYAEPGINIVEEGGLISFANTGIVEIKAYTGTNLIITTSSNITGGVTAVIQNTYNGILSLSTSGPWLQVVNSNGYYTIDINLPMTATNIVTNVGTGIISGGNTNLGYFAGSASTGSTSLGVYAGNSGLGQYTVAVGAYSGQNNQTDYGVAIGYQAGNNDQGNSSVAIGALAGNYTQQPYSVAVGIGAGEGSQGEYAVSLGSYAGNANQSSYAISIGSAAGNHNQGNNAVAIGGLAANYSQAGNAVAIGYSAGRYYQGQSAIAIGYLAGITNDNGGNPISTYNQHANSIIINATGSPFNNTTTSGLFVAPVRAVASIPAGFSPMYYNTTTGEMIVVY